MRTIERLSVKLLTYPVQLCCLYTLHMDESIVIRYRCTGPYLVKLIDVQWTKSSVPETRVQ